MKKHLGVSLPGTLFPHVQERVVLVKSYVGHSVASIRGHGCEEGIFDSEDDDDVST